jgi:hypothetical protein
MLKPLLVSASLTLAVIGGPITAQQKSQSVQDQVALKGLPAYSAEGRQVGVVTQVRIGSNGQVEAVRIDLPKSPETDAKTVQIPAARFTQKADRIVLSLTAAEVADLPHMKW